MTVQKNSHDDVKHHRGSRFVRRLV